MRPFERLLYASDSELKRIFQQFDANPTGSPDRIGDAIAQNLGLDRSQLLCGCGFNPNLLRVPQVLNVLGMATFNTLWSERNGVFVNDVYRMLLIDDILAIYAMLGRGDGYDRLSDLIARRFETIEAQIEATINPITLGSYKLEVRSIYERNLVSRQFIESRLEGNYAVLRRLSNEISMMLATGLITPAEIMTKPGVTVEEKTRLI